MKKIAWLLAAFLPLILLENCKNKTADSEQGDASNALIFKRFEKIPSERSGVHFINKVVETADLNYFSANYIYIGGGVAVGDFNNDGLEDLYFVSVQGENKLYQNKGNFQFDDITAKAGVALPRGIKSGVTVVDINNDGWLDIYQCRAGQSAPERGNSLLVNNGDGTFTDRAAEFGLNTQNATVEANFFDYDKDGDLDVYMINRPLNFAANSEVKVKQAGVGYVRDNVPENEIDSDKLFRNNGNGTFTDVSREAGIFNWAFSLCVRILDINEDGYPDIYIGNDYIEPDQLYINNRNGTFSDRWDVYFRHLSHFSMGSDVADFNNDGLLDITVLDMLPADNYRQKQNGTVMKLERYNNLVNYGYGHQIMRNMLHLNNGNGSFNEIGCLAGIEKTDWSWAPLVADFDNDGWKDLFITNGIKRDVSESDFSLFVIDSLQKAGFEISNFDKVLPLMPSKKLRNYLFKNNGDLTTQDLSEAWGFADPTFSNGAAYVDLDDDGDLDIVVHNTDDEAFLYQNRTAENKDGNFLKIALTGDPKNPRAIGATVNLKVGDQQQIVQKYANRGFLSSFDQELHFGLGKATTVAELTVTWPDGKRQRLQNIPANQTLKLNYADAANEQQKVAVSNPFFQKQAELDYVHIENPFEDFSRERLLPRRYSAMGPALATADVNGDKLDDVFIGGSFQQEGAVFIQQSNGSFIKMALNPNVRLDDVDAIFFDANGDGAPDLYVVSGGNEAPVQKGYYVDRLYLNDGKGNLNYSSTALPLLDESGSAVAVFDFDNDNDLDVFIGGSVRPGEFPFVSKSYILENNGGAFKDVTSRIAPDFGEVGIVRAIQFGDLDGDRQAEMVVAGDWMPITVFKVSKSGFQNISSLFGLENTEGWWHCLAISDFNGDGKNDIAAGNLGLNCRLKASTNEPVEVVAVDIDGNGKTDPLLTHYNGGVCVPVPHRDDFLTYVPSLKRKFLRYREYSNANVSDLIPKEMLPKAVRRRATVFASSIFLSQPSGKFSRLDLPTTAQTAPMQDMLVMDFNNDKHLDILAVGNDLGLEIESGRQDASDGWLLLGKGNGQFDVPANKSTGFWASKDARKVRAVSNSKGSKKILVSNNGSAVQVFSVVRNKIQ